MTSNLSALKLLQQGHVGKCVFVHVIYTYSGKYTMVADNVCKG